MHRIERRNEIRFECKCIGLDKFEWVVRLGLNIYTNNLKSCLVVPKRRTPGTAEQV